MGKQNIGLYIHYPFCRQKCNYCDFYTVKYNGETKVKEYVNAVIDHIEMWSKKIHKNIDTIYFGGGTPSLVEPSDIKKTIEKIKESFCVSENCEITIETNPDDLTKSYCEDIYKSGVNRISIGIQSLDATVLKNMGRMHSTDVVENAIINARKAGFSKINIDLIIGFESDSNQLMKENIEFLKKFDITHVSMYMLKVEEGTLFYKNKDEFNFLHDDEISDLYLYAVDILEKAGYNQYEISNFCKDGHESLHNLKYWQCEDYLGIGPSAHSMIDKKRFYYKKGIDNFINLDSKYILENEQDFSEIDEIIFPIRLKKGVEKLKIFKMVKNPQEKIDYLRDNYFINDGESRISLTRKGILLSNFVINYILD